jgi:hypothetical protein
MRRVVIGLLLVVVVGLFVVAGRNGAEERPAASVSAAVEYFIPASGSPSVLRQAEVGVDLATGWFGVLVINGVEIPEDQLRRVDPLSQVFFTPGEGRELERFPAGTVQAEALIWRPVDGETRDDARRVRWSFRVV